MIDFTLKSQYGFDDLVLLVRRLRAPGGCEWDRAQTHASIRRNFLEEAFEAVEAIDDGDPAHLCEELGDVLLQVVFHALIEQEAGRFGPDEVCDLVCKKLIDRHPHLFTEGQARQDWEELKRSRRGQTTVAQAMEGVSKALPASWRADKLLSKAERSGLEPNDPAAALAELKLHTAALSAQALDADAAPAIVGELLFDLVRLAHGYGADPEAALNTRCTDFIRAFREKEDTAAESLSAETTNRKR